MFPGALRRVVSSKLGRARWGMIVGWCFASGKVESASVGSSVHVRAGIVAASAGNACAWRRDKEVTEMVSLHKSQKNECYTHDTTVSRSEKSQKLDNGCALWLTGVRAPHGDAGGAGSDSDHLIHRVQDLSGEPAV